MKNIGIIIELENGKIKEANFGQITMVRQEGATLFALLMDGDAKNLQQDLAPYGISKIIDISFDSGSDYKSGQLNNPVIKAKALIDIIKDFNLSVVVGLSTAMGKDLLPRMAALLDAPLIMDCFDIDLEQNHVKTSQYSGKTIATIEVTGEVIIFGIRPNSHEPEPVLESNPAQIIEVESNFDTPDEFKVVKADVVEKSSMASLVEAEIILAGGRGMKNGENFEILFECAQKLNAAVGSSRVAVDSGWVPYSMQIGQTGEKVSPKVYIACGISGSVQHFAGMKTSGTVIAINTDENAFIVSNCDYYVIGDVLEIIPELTKLL